MYVLDAGCGSGEFTLELAEAKPPGLLATRRLVLTAKFERSRPASQACESSRNTSGCLTATRSRVRAAPVGSRLRCSQSCSVRLETPSRSANSTCDNPICIRASATGESSTFVLRAALPRFICSTEVSRSAWKLSNSLSIADTPFQSRKYLRLGDRSHFYAYGIAV